MYNAKNILIANRVKDANIIHYKLDYTGYHYDIFYEHGLVIIKKNNVQVFLQQISHQNDESWNDNETIAYLHWIKQAIINGTIEALKLPSKDEIFSN